LKAYSVTCAESNVNFWKVVGFNLDNKRLKMYNHNVNNLQTLREMITKNKNDETGGKTLIRSEMENTERDPTIQT
jgi:hypothetical protein